MSQENVQERTLARTHALYYAATGIWPLLNIHSFERITGPKVERWLVKTVGALVTAGGTSLAIAARDDPGGAEAVILATGSAAALACCRVVEGVGSRQCSSLNVLLRHHPRSISLLAGLLPQPSGFEGCFQVG